MTKSSYLTNVLSESEDGDYILEIPEEILEAVGWKEGAVLDCDIFAGALVIREISSSPQQDS